MLILLIVLAWGSLIFLLGVGAESRISLIHVRWPLLLWRLLPIAFTLLRV